MTIFRVAPHPAVVKLRDESRDLASPWNEKIPPAKWYCVMQSWHSFFINEQTPFLFTQVVNPVFLLLCRNTPLLKRYSLV